MSKPTMNRYNAQRHKVTPASQGTAYPITPAQAQQLEHIATPAQAAITVPAQSSETHIDVSKIFEPLAIEEQFSPVIRAKGFALRAALFVAGALVVSLAAAWKLNLTRVDWFFGFAVLILLTLVILNYQEQRYSAAGLAVRHQADAKDALRTIVASNEAVTLAKLENEDRAHEREIALRREVLQSYLDKLGGNER